MGFMLVYVGRLLSPPDVHITCLLQDSKTFETYTEAYNNILQQYPSINFTVN